MMEEENLIVRFGMGEFVDMGKVGGTCCNAPLLPCNLDKKPHQASPEMKLFFDKLLELKAFVKEKMKEPHDQDYLLESIYERLDAIIKEKQ